MGAHKLIFRVGRHTRPVKMSLTCDRLREGKTIRRIQIMFYLILTLHLNNLKLIKKTSFFKMPASKLDKNNFLWVFIILLSPPKGAYGGDITPEMCFPICTAHDCLTYYVVCEQGPTWPCTSRPISRRRPGEEARATPTTETRQPCTTGEGVRKRSRNRRRGGRSTCCSRTRSGRCPSRPEVAAVSKPENHV